MPPLAWHVLDPTPLLGTVGSVAVPVVLLCETGLLLEFYLPRDSPRSTSGRSARQAAEPFTCRRPSRCCVALRALEGARLRPRRPSDQRAHQSSRAAPEGQAEAGRRPGAAPAGQILHRPRPRSRTFCAVRAASPQPAGRNHRPPTAAPRLWQAVGGPVWTPGGLLARCTLRWWTSNVDRYPLPIGGIVIAVNLSLVALDLLRSHCRRGTRWYLPPAGLAWRPARPPPTAGHPRAT